MRLVHYTYPNYRAFASAPNGFVRPSYGALDAGLSRLLASAAGGAGATAGFPVELREDANNTYVRAELPGVRREDINLELADGALAITATYRQKAGDQEETCSLNRTFRVPEAVQADKIAAVYENGVLTLTLPKAEAAKPRKIAVS